jgi:hypothetical protein
MHELLLPLQAAACGVTLPKAALLFAANDLVLIIWYGSVARSYECHAPRTACIGAVVSSAASSLGCVFAHGV